MATEKEIRDALRIWRTDSGHQLVIPNCNAFGWEADLLSTTRKLLIFEHEIKCSRADFDAEMRSAAFETDASRRWIVRHEARRAGKSISAAKCLKHAKLQDAHQVSLDIRKRAFERQSQTLAAEYAEHKRVKEAEASTPNYFAFVCPVGMIGVEDVPLYAGLIWYLESHKQYRNCFEVIKPAPRLHPEPISRRITLRIARSFEARYWKKYG